MTEIFAPFGNIKEIQFGFEWQWPWVIKGIAYIEYESPANSQNAIKYMYEGQVDDRDICTAPVLMPCTLRRCFPFCRRIRSSSVRRWYSPTVMERFLLGGGTEEVKEPEVETFCLE